jgi:hypothetical protein
MSTEHKNPGGPSSRWLRWALLTYTLAGPVINNALERVRQRSQKLPGVGQVAQGLQENAGALQTDAVNRLAELTDESRRRVALQVKRLREQAKQLEAQSNQLRKAVREEARQRRKLLKEMSKSGIDRSQDLLKQGSQLTGGFVERGGKIFENVVERSGKATQDVAERGGQVMQELAKRGKTATREALDRGEELLQPVRERRGSFWALIGFGVGLLAATIITYRLVRRRVELQELEAAESIELPRSHGWNGTGSAASSEPPAGEIRRVDEIGTAVSTRPVIEVEEMAVNEDASFVGVASTRFYYPAGTPPEGAKDLVYFNSEEEAQQQGFTRAENG